MKTIKVNQHKKVDPSTLKIYGYDGEWIQATSLERAMSIYIHEVGDDDFDADDWQERPLDGDEMFFLEDVFPHEFPEFKHYYVPENGEIIIKENRVYALATRRQWLEFNPYEQYYFSENI